MTAAGTRAPGAPAPGVRRSTTRGAGRLRPFQVPSEILLMFVTISTVFAFDRLFEGDTYFRPLMISAVVTHVVAAASRRLPGGLATTVVATAVALAVQISITFYSSTTVLGLPTGSTWTQTRTDLEDAWVAFNNVVPPAEPINGLLVAASVGIWLLVVLADWAAFRLRSAGEALLPSLGVLVFVTFFGRTVASLRDASIYLAAAVAFFGIHRAGERVSSGTWLGGDRNRAYGALVTWASIIGAAALLIGVVAGPLLPGAEDEALVDVQNAGSGGERARRVFSPLVDIKSRLVDQADVTMFTVRSSQESYYRMTALDSFNGRTWGSTAEYRNADGAIDNAFPIGTPDDQSNIVVQEFTTQNLGMVWLPAAHQPQSIQVPENVDVSYEPDSSTLIVDEVRGNSDGLTYSVVSEIPRYEPTDLQTGASDRIDQRFLALPDDFSPTAQALAEEVTAGKTGPFEKAKALQDHFQTPSLYSYSLDAAPGQSGSAIDAFLASGVGYCEQFAGTFAAMARAVGLPSRVVVGFTHGIQDPSDTDLYTVRGEHAHAWPEVFIPGAGWVLFEPTPGRGSPGAELYTGLASAQEESGTPVDPVEQESGLANIPNPAFDDEFLDPGIEDFAEDNPEADIAVAVEELDDPFTQTDGISLGLVALLSGIILGIPTLKLLLSRRRSEGTASARRKVELAWDRIVDLAKAVGVTADPGETSTEFAARLAGSLRGDPSELVELADFVTQGTFAPDPPSDDDVARAQKLAESVEKDLRRQTQAKDLVLYDIDPRGLFHRDASPTGVDDSAHDPLLDKQPV